MRPLLLVAALAAALPAAAARAADLPPELPAMEQEGEKWFNTAGDTDLSQNERNEARKKAWTNLYPALEILNRYWDDRPDDQARVEDRIMKVGQMVFWLRKESPLGLLESTGVGPKPSGNVKRNDWGDKPPPEKPGYAPGEDPGKPADGPAAPGPGPVAPAGPSLEESFAAAEAYAKKHRADLPGVMSRYQEVMARFPGMTGHPLYLEAARRAGAATSKLKDVYRRLRDDDPDSLKNADTAEVKGMVVVLGREMSANDAAVRRRAAGLLALLGSGEGVYPLVQAARKEADADALRAELDAVVAIGGRKAVEHLGRWKDDTDLAPKSLETLQRLCDRNAVDRRLAVKEIGAFAMAKDDAVAAKAVDFLIGIGKEGAFGLVEALDTRSVEVRLKVIPALAETGNPKVAGPLSKFLLMGDNPNTVACRKAAMEAVKTLGEPAVPYLFAGLRGTQTKQWTAALLREMTNQMFGSNRPGDWVNWWKRSHPDWKEEAE